MPDVTVEVEVTCEACGNDLSCSASRANGRLRCDPCDVCLANEHKAGYEEGKSECLE